MAGLTQKERKSMADSSHIVSSNCSRGMVDGRTDRRAKDGRALAEAAYSQALASDEAEKKCTQ